MASENGRSKTEWRPLDAVNCNNHLDSKIMKVNNKDIFIYCQKEDINKLFTYGKGYENRYNMYFAIPVYINDEIQGLFQITYFSESTLFNEKENIDFLINRDRFKFCVNAKN